MGRSGPAQDPNRRTSKSRDIASQNRFGIMRSRSVNGANRLNHCAHFRLVHLGPGGIKEPALRRTARHPATRVHGFHPRPNKIGHLTRLDPGPGNHLQSELNGLFDGGKAFCGPPCSTTGQHRSDTGLLQLSACLGVIDCFIKRPVKDDLIEAHGLI